MTPKEKAQDLWVKYYERLPDSIYSNYAAKMDAKYFALIAVNEILGDIDEAILHPQNQEAITYWNEVKQEIEKL